MKALRTTVLAITAVLGAFLVGCQPDNLNPTNDSATTLETMLSSAARYSAEADSTTKKYCKGKLTELAEADIPANVTAYIDANYGGATVKFAGKGENGGIVVALTLADGTPKGLIFDSAGTFVKELARHKQHAKLTEIAVADLSAAIAGYVSTNYAGATIKRAGTNEAGETFVLLATGNQPAVLVFNADGTFNKVLEKPMRHRKRK